MTRFSKRIIKKWKVKKSLPILSSDIKQIKNLKANVYGYIRVSTAQQASSLISQSEELQKRVKGLQPENIFEDIISGSEPFENRPGFSKLLNCLQPGDFLFVPKLDRFGRSMVETVMMITRLKKQGIQLFFLDLPVDQNLIENNLFIEFFFIIISYLAEFEKNRLKERQLAGIEQVKRLKFSNPEEYRKKYPGRKKVELDLKSEMELLNQLQLPKIRMSSIARSIGLSRSTFHRFLKGKENELLKKIKEEPVSTLEEDKNFQSWLTGLGSIPTKKYLKSEYQMKKVNSVS